MGGDRHSAGRSIKVTGRQLNGELMRPGGWRRGGGCGRRTDEGGKGYYGEGGGATGEIGTLSPPCPVGAPDLAAVKKTAASSLAFSLLAGCLVWFHRGS